MSHVREYPPRARGLQSASRRGGSIVISREPGPLGQVPVLRERLSVSTIAIATCVALLAVLTPIGPGGLAPVDPIILGAIITALVWLASTGVRVCVPYAIPVWIMAGAGTLAALFGPFPTIGILSIVQDIFLLGWSAAVANVIRTPAVLRIVLRTWVVASAVGAMLMVIGVLAGIDAIAGISAGSSRAAFLFGEQNGAGLYFAVSVMVVLAGQWPAHRLVRASLVVLLLLAVVMTGSIAAITGLAGGVLVASILIVRHRHGAVVAIGSTALVVLASTALMLAVRTTNLLGDAHDSSNTYIRNSIGRGQQSSSEREVLARETTNLYLTGGVLGRGPSSTEAALGEIQATYTKEAHNDYVAAIVERGVAGLLGVLVLVGAVILRAAAIHDGRRLVPPFRAVIPTPAYLVGALAIPAIFSVTHETLHDRTVWTLLGLVAGLYAWARQPAAGGGVAA